MLNQLEKNYLQILMVSFVQTEILQKTYSFIYNLHFTNFKINAGWNNWEVRNYLWIPMVSCIQNQHSLYKNREFFKMGLYHTSKTMASEKHSKLLMMHGC